MPQFAYQAFDQAGKTRTGVVEANDESGALDRLGRRSLTVFEIGPASLQIDRTEPWWKRDIVSGQKAIAHAQLAQFMSDFSRLLNASIATPDALEFSADAARDARLKELLRLASVELRAGKPLADALQVQPGLIPERVLTFIELGEEANRLAETTQHGAKLLAQEAKLAREVRGALVYPAILIFSSVLILLGLIFFLAPAMAPVFAATGTDVPTLLAWMIWLSGAVSWQGLAGMTVAASVMVVIFVFMGGKKGLIEPIVLTLPWIGMLVKAREAANLTRTLGLILESGGTLPQGLEVAERTSGMHVISRGLRDVRRGVLAGDRLSAQLRAQSMLPRLVEHMIEIGERSNTLPDMMRNATEVLDEDIERRLKSGVEALTPILTLLIGLLVGSLVVTTLSALLDLGEVAI